eukprot:TRINITY_DN6390_c1_g1_i1.p1 TRINITY_DN6390_c1_g1~~TRINITY_DN6390_c1_g1_i1.p1  ORF type:complete len:728 (+),score=98.54 TRINITY_DN6390_c1_g1_i1:30-2186(+)
MAALVASVRHPGCVVFAFALPTATPRGGIALHRCVSVLPLSHNLEGSKSDCNGLPHRSQSGRWSFWTKSSPVLVSGCATMLAMSTVHSCKKSRSAGARSFCAVSRSASRTGTLDAMAGRCVNSWIVDLQQDPEALQNAPNHAQRQVRSGHYVFVEPMPLPDPYLVAFSPDMAKILDLSEEECKSGRFVGLFSGDLSVVEGFRSWATPYALSIYGHEMTQNCPFGNGNGYGDGRALSIAEVAVVNHGTERWELQLKGAGKTPFCRGADGRAVLRSSVREFLASEAMHSLGVPTTRAVSLVGSGSLTSMRPWYSEDLSGSGGADTDEKVDDMLRRLLKQQRNQNFDELSDETKHGLREQLRRELSSMRQSRNPNMMVEERCAITCRAARSFLRVGHIELFARRARGGDPLQLRELELIVEHALTREFPDVVPGKPFQARVVAMLRVVCQRFAALVADWIRVGFVQGNFNSDNCLVGGRTMDYGPFGFIERYEPLWNMWVGGDDKYGFLNQPNAMFKNFESLANALTPILDESMREEVTRIVEGFHDAASSALTEVWRRKLGLRTWEPQVFAMLEPLLRSARADYTIFWRALADVCEKCSADMDDAALVEPLLSCFYEPLANADETRWALWLRLLLDLISAQGRTGAEAAAEMRQASPKYVPREWMLVEAYNAAINGDHTKVHELQRVFAAPYAEQPEFHERFFRRTPQNMQSKGGVSWMS